MNLGDTMGLLTKRETTAPEIIVADHRLPDGATGVGAVTHLFAINTGRAIFIIILTGDFAGGTMREIADQGYRFRQSQ